MSWRTRSLLAVVALAAGCGGAGDEGTAGGGTLSGVAATTTAVTSETPATTGDEPATSEPTETESGTTAGEGATFTLEPGADGCDHREPPHGDGPTSYDEPAKSRRKRFGPSTVTS